ncbi:MAG: UDP-N-acetylmuramoyl-L-alanyl-D-glutamate--2,6-diaminopimelate ligase [Zoogloeaceae bacterium]|nr:UDP-N-acetylmuramoyl-L-alanyl-D-glutamate--2,6-diaminopimelate ligase [Zoogloeaceae bacterium]
MSPALQVRDLLERLQAAGVTPSGLQSDSRRIAPGDLFLAMPGANADGRDHVDAALAAGAAAVVYETADGGMLSGLAVPCFGVNGLRELSGYLAHEFHGRPSEEVWVAGVTGTNGKTTSSQWLAQALEVTGCRCGVIGTLGWGVPGMLEPLLNTTPDALAVHNMLASFRDGGTRAVAMEVSSIGLDQGRVNGVRFAVAMFTNLTRDHLEYHGDMESYAQAKARLFDLPDVEHAVINIDDAFGLSLARKLVARCMHVIAYTREGASLTGAEVLAAHDVLNTPTGLRFTASWHGESAEIALGMVGEFNVSNALAVIGALLARGIAFDEAARAAGRLVPPPGRMQLFGGVGEPLVLVDYAHTPDALGKVLAAARETASGRGGRLVCVFGCGGDRDPGKRPLMGEVASRLADAVLVTSDNPRNEDPRMIADMVMAGCDANARCELDRAAAIAQVVREAGSNDVVVIAGKGHEPYQEIKGQRQPFSDAEQATAALRGRGRGGNAA